MEFNKEELLNIDWCMNHFVKVSNYGQVGEKRKEDIDKIILKLRNRNSQDFKPVIETISYNIDTSAIRIDSIVQYKESGKEWFRGMVKYVDRDRIKITRSVGINYSFSATQIGRGDVSLKIEIY